MRTPKSERISPYRWIQKNKDISTKMSTDTGLPSESTASESTALLISSSLAFVETTADDKEVRLLVYALFTVRHAHHQHPNTIPSLCPETRGTRHRHPIVNDINEFRHWWKTSRLLVRLVGSYEWCNDTINWTMMGIYNVSKHKQAHRALKHEKAMGRGGPNRDFLSNVHPFTRTLRLSIAICRGLEARVDNRLAEVGLAEAMAFIGNRCFRYWARHWTDHSTSYIMLPLSAKFIAPYLDQKSRPVIVTMGLLRAILPFTMSFFGSALGRKLTLYTFSAFHYRWKPIQGTFHFHEKSGVYQDVDPDPKLFELACQIALAIGHGDDAWQVRSNLFDIGFDTIFGAGSGGYSVYRKSSNGVTLLYVTPYGPSVLNEMPRYIILERRPTADSKANSLLSAAVPAKAVLTGFSFSGAFFTSQEWAALQNRFEEEMNCYRNACGLMGSILSHIDSTTIAHNELVFPPTDLLSLKTFIQTGKIRKKQRKDDMKWKIIQREVQKMAKTVQQHQLKGTAPKGVVLYMEGLDCSGKSSTGGLVQEALERSGYEVDMQQYNRPPTEEQKKMAWMSRFARPSVEDQDHYKATVGDRGPAGDFVYGNLNQLPVEEKLQRYAEFRAFDRDCQVKDILFFKLLFVTDKDTIAGTLGKRLAHNKIAQDLRTWLDSNSPQGHSAHEGLAAIEAHVDPTDFIAFNRYSENLENFCDFARNTDHNGYDSPWFVVCTSNRHAVRLALMKAFSKQIKKFSKQQMEEGSDAEAPPVAKGIVEAREHGISYQAVFQTFLLICLAYAYAHQTWHIGDVGFT